MVHLIALFQANFTTSSSRSNRDLLIDLCRHVNYLTERAFQQTSMTTTTTTTIAIMQGVQVPKGGVCFDTKTGQDWTKPVLSIRGSHRSRLPPCYRFLTRNTCESSSHKPCACFVTLRDALSLYLSVAYVYTHHRHHFSHAYSQFIILKFIDSPKCPPSSLERPVSYLESKVKCS